MVIIPINGINKGNNVSRCSTNPIAVGIYSKIKILNKKSPTSSILSNLIILNYSNINNTPMPNTVPGSGKDNVFTNTSEIIWMVIIITN